MEIKITELVVKDIRFPTSKNLAGSDAIFTKKCFRLS